MQPRRASAGPRWALGLCALGAACGGAGPGPYQPNAPTGYNVVFVTVDGVRWQELFAGPDPLLTAEAAPLFPAFWAKLAPRGVVYGDPRARSQLKVATSANASLPGYMSLYAETEQGCLTNFCDRIQVPTFLDRLHDELPVPREQLAVYAAWWKLRLAATGRDDVAVVEAGGGDPALEEGHPQAALLEPAFEFDRHTVLEGFEALARHPRFLHLAFLDSDRYGHQNDYPRYLAALRAYDRLLGELVDRLDASGEYGRKTALVITTDHGRGLWDQWQDHGPQLPASAGVWAFVMLPPDATELSLLAPAARPFTHHDVRYAIEALFGLATAPSARASTGFVVRAGPAP